MNFIYFEIVLGFLGPYLKWLLKIGTNFKNVFIGACNTCVRLQSRVTSSGTTVNSWMIFFIVIIFFYFIKFLFIYLFFPFSPLLVCFACFCFVAVYYVLIFYWPIFLCVLLSLSSPPSFFILRAGFISLLVGLGLIFHWSEIKISHFGVVYNFLSVDMELTVIKELFIILYI